LSSRDVELGALRVVESKSNPIFARSLYCCHLREIDQV
jgi:hypothetical protein